MDPLTWMHGVLFAVGAAAGFVDAIAGGGGLLTVPALLAAGLPPQVALGTNKFQSSCGTALATWNYSRAGLIAWGKWKVGVAATFLAAIAGTGVVTAVDPSQLRRLIPIALGVIVVYMAVKPDLGARERPAQMGIVPFGLLFGVILGFYDGFLGPGTGSFWMMACVLVRGLDLRGATGVTKAMNLTSNLASLGYFLIAGKVDFLVGGLMAAGQLLGAHLGSHVAIRAGARVIRPVFFAVVLSLAATLTWDAFTP